jgi:ribonuclease R
MKRALYSTKEIGHFGLAKKFYTHFTSPIRRYPDLVIHRILKSALITKQSTYSDRKLTEMAEHCSERERNAESAERDLKELKIIRYFENQLKTGDLREYLAVIVDVRNFGMFVDIPEVQAYGLIHVSMLKDDYYDFDPAKNTFKGRHSSVIFGIGTTLTVTIAKIVPEKRLLDFVPVS